MEAARQEVVAGKHPDAIGFLIFDKKGALLLEWYRAGTHHGIGASA